jgi:hypothetical protein
VLVLARHLHLKAFSGDGLTFGDLAKQVDGCADFERLDGDVVYKS